jgi:iron complex transport system substrate-binding protein
MVSLLAALCAAATAASAAPQRILSANLCGDELLVALADPGQIVGLSRFSVDPTLSNMVEKAKTFPRPDQRSEAVVALQPELVLGGPRERSNMRKALTNLGMKIYEVAIVTDIMQARMQVREVATLIGHPARGEALVAEIDAALVRLARVARNPPATALMVERKGYVTGPHSLPAALLRAAGFVPPEGAPSDLGGYVPMEKLLVLRPDVLVMHDLFREAEDQGSLYLTHPALAALYPPERRLLLPRRYAICGGPALLAALNYLTQVLSATTPR